MSLTLLFRLYTDTASADPYELLKKWSLEMYGKMLIDEKGYDNPSFWKRLSMEKLVKMGFKEGHAEQFVECVKQSNI